MASVLNTNRYNQVLNMLMFLSTWVPLFPFDENYSIAKNENKNDHDYIQIYYITLLVTKISSRFIFPFAIAFLKAVPISASLP